MRSIRTLHVIIGVLGIALAGQVRADEAPAKEPPTPTETTTPEGPFLGRLKVIDVVLNTSIERLGANDLAGFVDTANNLVLAFDGLSSDVQEAFRSSGEALARLEHAILMLEESEKRQNSSGATLNPALEELRSIRQRLLSRLGTVHSSYRQSDGNQAKQCLEEMQDTTEKIRQIDELLASQSRVSAASLPVRELVSRLRTAMTQVKDDQDVLLAQVEALSSIVQQSFRTMETSLRMRQVSEAFPQIQIESLRETRRSLSELIRLSSVGQTAALQTATSSVEMLSRPSVNEQQVLSEAEGLLRTSVSTKCR